MPQETIGKIPLSRTTELRFEVSPYKGKNYINIRQFVESTNFSGFTKKGVTLTPELGAQLLDSFKQYKQSELSDNQVEICRLIKNDTTELVVQIIQADEKHDTASLDVREYIQSETYAGWTQKGFRLSLDKLGTVINLLEQCLEKLDQETTAGDTAKSE